MSHRTVDTVVIGAGQAGLAMGWHLLKSGCEFVILDAGSRAGETWSNRWDSLRLFTPAKFSGLPGRPFPAADFDLPTKDDVSHYLRDYAGLFKLPILFNMRAERLSHDGRAFEVQAGSAVFHSRQVIVSTGAYSNPFVPTIGSKLNSSTVQFHSSEYRNPSQVPEGDVLVVGAGNSGAEIAVELARTGRGVWLSGRDTGRIPADKLGKLFGGKLYWWVISRVLSRSTPMGRKVAVISSSSGTPLIGIHPSEIIEAGVRRVNRVSGVIDGRPLLDDGTDIDPGTVIWATGYRQDYSWIDLPVFDDASRPRHSRGVAVDIPNLFFLGMHFQYSLSSALLGGVGADAAYLAGVMQRNVSPAALGASATI